MSSFKFFHIHTAMAFNKIFLLFLALAAITCSPKNREANVSLKAPVDSLIPIDSIIVDTANPFYPFDIIDVEPGYIVQTQRSPAGFIRVFDATDREHMYDSGKQGRGPGEFSMPPFFINAVGEELILSDVMDFSQEHYLVTDTSLIHQRSASLRYDGQPSLLERIVWYGQGLYLADNYPADREDNHEYILLENDNDQILEKFGSYPVQDLSPDEKFSRFLKTTAVHPDNKKIMSFYMRYDALTLYEDPEDSRLVFIDGSNMGDFTLDQGDHLSRIVQDWSADRIATLGIYANSSEVYDDVDQERVTYLELWDWQGKNRYRVPFDRLIHGFTVSYVKSEIYAYSLTDPAKLLIYKLPEYE